MTAVLFISMVILLFLGVPIAFVLGGSSVLALACLLYTSGSIGAAGRRGDLPGGGK